MPCVEVDLWLIITISKCILNILMLPGSEHSATAGGTGQPSYCTLPIFHAPRNPNRAAADLGYVSNDGHHFSCTNPIVMQQAFHV
jgi:hypothetical protein